REEHGRGVRRLARLALADRCRQARRQLPVSPKLALLYAAIEEFRQAPGQPPAHEHLREDLVQSALGELLAGPLEAIRDRAAFQACVDEAGRRLFPLAVHRLELAERILAQVAAIKPQLE